MNQQSVLNDRYAADARDCLKTVGERYGVDLLSAADKADQQQQDIGDAVRAVLYPALLKEMNASAPGEDPEVHEAIKAALQEAQDSSVSIFVNMSYNQNQVATLQAKTGNDIAEFASGLKSILQLTQGSGMTPLEIALAIGGTVLFGGLGPVCWYAAKATGVAAETWIGRLAFGIKKVGVAGWGALAAVIVIEIGLYLMSIQANFLAVIVNNTNEQFEVEKWRKGVDSKNDKGIYLNHGKVAGFMVADLSKIHTDDETQLGGIQTFEVNNEQISMVNLALFYAKKRDAAWFGCEGAIVFKPKHQPSSSPSLAFAYSCPYSGSNGANVLLTTESHTAKHWWEQLHSTLALSTTSTLSPFSVVANVNSQSGPDASCIVVLNQS